MAPIKAIIILGLIQTVFSASGHWEFQVIRTWGDEGIVNATRWDGHRHPVTLQFDACGVMEPKSWTNCGGLGWERYYATQHKYLCFKSRQKGDCDNIGEFYCPYWSCPHAHSRAPGSGVRLLRPPANCSLGRCNPIAYDIRDPGDPKWSQEVIAGVRIDGKGIDPGAIIKIVKSWVVNPTSCLRLKPHSAAGTPPTVRLHPSCPLQTWGPLEFPLWEIVNATHQLQLVANPSLGSDCWLCTSVTTWTYIGLGVNGIVTPEHSGTAWPVWPSVTSVGNASCVRGTGTQPNVTANCTQIWQLNSDTLYRPPNGTYFSCSDGVYARLNGSRCSLCAIIILPQI